MSFQKAVKKQAKLKIGLSGPSGAGKTYSALKIASGMSSKRIALIDTENRSASLYADEFDFDSNELDPPYTVDKYINAITEAIESNKYDVLIVDSITHQWAGEGGILNQKEILDSRPGSNHWTNWAKLTPEQERFKNAILHSNIHMICTMRSKQEHAMQDDNGKKKVVKLGMAPIQREGMEYEFTVMFDLAANHTAIASKTRIKAFDDKVFTPNKATGQQLIRWLMQGEVVPQPTPRQPLPPAQQKAGPSKPQPPVESEDIPPPPFNADEPFPEHFNEPPPNDPPPESFEPPPLPTDLEGIGNLVMSGKQLQGITIKDAWETKRAKAIQYAVEVARLSKEKKAGPKQLAFVDYGVQKNYISEEIMR